MDIWNRRFFYKKSKDSDPKTVEVIVGQPDEALSTDNEIFTRTTSAETREPASISGVDRSQDTYTVDDALEATGFGKFQWKISFITGLSWIADAMEMMILSILGPQLHCEWELPGLEVALITSVVFIGMGISSPIWGNIADKYGRKTSLICCMLWTLYYGLLSSFAPEYGWIIALRGLVGFGIGGAPQAVTLYSEFLPVKSRGLCIMLIASFWAFGAVCEVLLALLIMPSLGWRWLLGVSVFPMALFVLCCFWLPESPRFDVLTGRSNRAMKTLEHIAKENKKSLPPGRLIAVKVQSNRGRVKNLFVPKYRRTTLLLCFIWLANAFCYYGIVLLTTEMFQDGDACGTTQGAKNERACRMDCKFLTEEDYKDLLWTTLAEFPGLLIILVAIDYIGRKKSMALCFFMFTLCMLPMYACIGRVALTVLIFVARAAISGGYQVVFVYTPEVFPTEIRALAMGICSAMARVGALITPFIAQVLLRTSVYLTLSVYCVVSLLAGIAALFLPFETLGKSLPEFEADQGSSTEPMSNVEQVEPTTSSLPTPSGVE